jgi:NADPH:quinone reductase-like Zn-dependent oxidoreductase
MLRVGIAEVSIGPPGDDDVIIAVEASPINPADIACLLAGAEPQGLHFAGAGQRRFIEAKLSPAATHAARGRFDKALPVGLEGAGTVIAAGRNARHLQGKRVAAMDMALGFYGEYCTVPATSCAPLPDGVPTRQGADVFCNPLTALAIVETLRQTSHRALIHTAAASSLGQMLVRICQEDGIALVNIVRRKEQVQLLQAIGAKHICNSTDASFPEDLLAAIRETGAMVAFDAIGGGALAGVLLGTMEVVAAERSGQYNPYGTAQDKRVYCYGRLDPGPTIIARGNYGLVWGVDGWAMPPILERAGADRVAQFLRRITANLTTTFASHYAHEISFAQLLAPETVAGLCRQATGLKYLLNPQLG